MLTRQSRQHGNVGKRKKRLGAALLLFCFIMAAVALRLLFDIVPGGIDNGSFSASPSEESPAVAVEYNPIGRNTALPDVKALLQALAQEDERIVGILVHTDEYPEELLELLIKNPEARDFVLGYPSHKDGPVLGGLEEPELSGGIPLLMQWDERWGYFHYGSGPLGVTGCGPACLSMVAVALTGNRAATPDAVAAFSERNGYYIPETGTSWELLTTGAKCFGLDASEVPLWEHSMIAELRAGRPIIANVGPGDFTDEGHFIVIRGYENGTFLINDPNSRLKSREGWLYETLEKQIRSLWSYART